MQLERAMDLEAQDTALNFFKRLILSVLLLNLAIKHFNEPASPRGRKGPVCSKEFANMLLVRFAFSNASRQYNQSTELRAVIRLLNMYLKVSVHLFNLICMSNWVSSGGQLYFLFVVSSSSIFERQHTRARSMNRLRVSGPW